MCIRRYRQNEDSSSEAMLLNGTDSGSSISLLGLRRKKRRKKIWELEHRFHCSIAGTCFTLDELRRFCRKAQGKIKGPISDYELHITFVGILENAHAARPANKYLDRKYRTAIQHFDPANSPEALLNLWNEAVSQGDIASAFWAVTTHPLASEKLLFRVYGEVHMLSHLSGASIRLDMQALKRLRLRVPTLEHELAESRAELLHRMRKKDETIQVLNKRLAVQRETERTLCDTQQRLHELESGNTLSQLRSRLKEQSDELNDTLLRVERAEAATGKWQRLADESVGQRHSFEQQIAELVAERDTLEISLKQILSTHLPPCGDSDDQHVDLCRRCILYVGGRDRQCGHFRALVERQNGHFIHHDGGLAESGHRLAALLPKADVVLCPLDCVSHEAVKRIVRHCRQYGKSLKLLPKSSLTAFSRGLNEFAKNEATRSFCAGG